MKAFISASNLFLADSVNECKLRDAIKFCDFEDVAEMLQKEKSLNRMRRNRKIMSLLGEEHFKIRSLNMNAFICSDNSGKAVEVIIGKRKLPSPPLS